MELTTFFRSVMEQDKAPVVLCDTEHTIVYMNPAATERYAPQGGAGLTGQSLMKCHPPKAREQIEKVLNWFRESKEHNFIYEFRNDEENKDVYMVALRDENGELIGYYEKHEYRNRETAKLYDMEEAQMEFEDLQLVNYCYPGCIPMLNIMRLGRDEAFELAARMAEEHPKTTAFYRFADFQNYYALREAQDAFLYRRFTEKGGNPRTEHPLSFVIDGSDYLKDWFGNGLETRITMKDIDPESVSFTIGDSGAIYQHTGTVELLTWDDMKKLYRDQGNDLRKLLAEYGRKYVEVQLWTETIPNKQKEERV